MENQRKRETEPCPNRIFWLIGLVLVAFNSYWCLMGDRGLALYAVNDRLVVLQCGFHGCLSSYLPICCCSDSCHGWRCRKADLQTIYVMVVMVNNHQRTYHDGIPHPSPRAYIFSSQPPKMSGYRSLETISPVGSPSKAPRIVDGFYNGDSTLYNSATLNAWLPPVLSWSSFVIAPLADVISRNDLSP